MLDFCLIRTIQTALHQLDVQIRDVSGISLNEAYCLCAVSEGIAEPGRLAEEIGLSRSRLSRILDTLETKGLLERTISPDDRRNILVRLTEKGNNKIHKLHHTDIALMPPLSNIIKKNSQ
ncbi:MAG: MarR family transcriptional regulator [Sphaerochaetaceae bacterium]|jgi:DNA-binding MarR family transcriptional regulator|nr:MarR family transcriptional regulator [Sphaerochaetaceae bacterium]